MKALLTKDGPFLNSFCDAVKDISHFTMRKALYRILDVIDHNNFIYVKTVNKIKQKILMLDSMNQVKYFHMLFKLSKNLILKKGCQIDPILVEWAISVHFKKIFARPTVF